MISLPVNGMLAYLAYKFYQKADSASSRYVLAAGSRTGGGSNFKGMGSVTCAGRRLPFCISILYLEFYAIIPLYIDSSASTVDTVVNQQKREKRKIRNPS